MKIRSEEGLEVPGPHSKVPNTMDLSKIVGRWCIVLGTSEVQVLQTTGSDMLRASYTQSPDLWSYRKSPRGTCGACTSTELQASPECPRMLACRHDFTSKQSEKQAAWPRAAVARTRWLRCCLFGICSCFAWKHCGASQPVC